MTEGSRSAPLRLFQGFGVELEYMLVRSSDLAVIPICDEVLRGLASGETVNDVEIDTISWSNELVMHVIELKNTDPASSLAPLGGLFLDHVGRMNRRLEPLGAMLLPGGMHPFMRPADEAKIWPHEGREIYQAFDRLFDCRRHGWANVQSVQLNLSFGDDAEFGKLHAAIRALLPALPALAASSPVVEGRLTGLLDNRLEFYRTNSDRVPEITGQLVPEPIFSRSDYEAGIFEPMYRAIQPLDPSGTLRHPWLNARGAIAQFPRDAIEIRVLDMQENPFADVAICRAVEAVVRALVEERLSSGADQRAIATEPLHAILRAAAADAEETVVRDQAYLRLFDFKGSSATLKELWRHLGERLESLRTVIEKEPMKTILERGPLARRVVRALGPSPRREDIESVYRELGSCLAAGRSFLGP